MVNTAKQSLALHKKYGGKLKINSKVPLRSTLDLCLAYTPGVAAVCKAVAGNPRSGNNLTIKGNLIAVVSDGSAVLGLGNIGPIAALPVMEGKAILHKTFAGTDVFPLCLDTQNVKEIIQTIKAVSPIFSAIQLEDISAPRCFAIQRLLEEELDIPVLHDDRYCTAVVVLAALINALKIKKLAVNKTRVVINGAGAAGFGICELLLAYGFKNLIALDSQGAIYKGRKNLSPEKRWLADKTNRDLTKDDLNTCLKNADIFIGVSKAGLLKPSMIKLMNKNPIIFALANPKPEIMPDVAKKAGALIVATGRGDFPNQINNVLAFPGIFRGAIDNRIKKFTPKMLLNAAIALAGMVKQPSTDKILPNLFDKRVVKIIAKTIK